MFIVLEPKGVRRMMIPIQVEELLALRIRLFKPTKAAYTSLVYAEH